jgi:hypothetical protein
MLAERGLLWCLGGVLIQLAACASALPKPATAWVVNASRTTECAEEDNVYVKLSGADLRGMRIEARQPRYIAQIKLDDSKADFTHCAFEAASNPVYHFEPKQVVLWEDEHWLMLGNTYETFWRPDQVDVVVHGQVSHQIHLIQLHIKDASEPSAGRHEFLVLYPPDGYWRAKPIPALPLPSSAYGTSFLVGPVKDAVRPVVELAKVEFVPEQMLFVIDYEDGSRGTMHVADVNREKVVLEYTHDRAQPEGQPLAAIRSMFVTAERSDVAEVSLQPSSPSQPSVQPLPAFTRAPASEVSFGRSQVSRHNTSAPDMWFGQFLLGKSQAAAR